MFEKTNLRNKEALNKHKFNDDSPEDKILSKNSGSQASDTLFIDTKVSKKEKRKKENQDIQQEDIFEKAKDVTIISKSACSSDLSYHQSFSTSLLDHFKLWSYKEMVTAYLGHYVSKHLETIHFFSYQANNLLLYDPQ